MRGEVIRVLVAADDGADGTTPNALFPQAEARTGTCTSRSTVYAASIAAGMMAHQLARWLRGVPMRP